MSAKAGDRPVNAHKSARSGAHATVRKHVVTADESGLRLDRWFKRRYPMLALSHLNKIVRKGEVRVDGKRVETATRLEEGATIRVPPLDLADLAFG